MPMVVGSGFGVRGFIVRVRVGLLIVITRTINNIYIYNSFDLLPVFESKKKASEEALIVLFFDQVLMIHC